MVADKPNVLGLAIKQLLERGFDYEGAIRPREEILGVMMKQGPRLFTLIAKAAGWPGLGLQSGRDTIEESVLSVHRFLIVISDTGHQPLVLAYKPWKSKIRFYIFDPWKIRKATIIRGRDYAGYEFPLSLGRRYDLSKDLETLWVEMRETRYKEVKLDRFSPRKGSGKRLLAV